MKTQKIATVNNAPILVLNDGEELVPIKPICDALGIAFAPQFKKLKEDETLGSVVTLRVTTGRDQKKYEMVCLPYEFIFGWLFTINPNNVKPEAKEAVTKYRLQCYKVLFQHFADQSEFLKDRDRAIAEITAIEDDARANFKDAKKVLEEAMKNRKEVMAGTFEDWISNKRQISMHSIDGFSEEKEVNHE